MSYFMCAQALMMSTVHELNLLNGIQNASPTYKETPMQMFVFRTHTQRYYRAPAKGYCDSLDDAWLYSAAYVQQMVRNGTLIPSWGTKREGKWRLVCS